MASQSSAASSSSGSTGNGDSWFVRIDEMLAMAQAKQEQAEKENSIRRKSSIYKIPPRLEDEDREAYTPRLVSLGPYHHSCSHLHRMEQHKWRAVKRSLVRYNKQVKAYIDAMKEVEERARACYEEPLSQSSNEFVEMMMLDACFVLEIFRCNLYGSQHFGYTRNDPVFSDRGVIDSIRRDMFLVENQIPLFILDNLLSIQEGISEAAPGYVTGFLGDHGYLRLWFINDCGVVNFEEGHSFQFIWQCLMVGPEPVPSQNINPGAEQWPIFCAIKLRDAGIKFKILNTDVLCRITFENGILKIPPISIVDETESLLLNLIAYERCADTKMYYANSYVLFMSELIKSSDDVKYLEECGILDNQLKGYDAVVDMFYRLRRKANVNVNGNFLEKVTRDVRFYIIRKRGNAAWMKNLKKGLKERCFNNPLAIISITVGAILLVATVVQTIYSVYGTYKP